jgi:hypothetical protein
MQQVEVEMTDQGYLHLSAEVASRFFPNDAVVATRENGELWLWPTSGPAAGGLLLKQRNPQGDRSVLLTEVLGPNSSAGVKPAVWDEDRHVLRVRLQPEPVLGGGSPEAAVGAVATVEEEEGRWVVYLSVSFWNNEKHCPLETTKQRIADYPTREQAEVAAFWMHRSADRNLPDPPARS